MFKWILVLTPIIQQCCRILDEPASAAAVSPEFLVFSSPDTQSQRVCGFSGYQIFPGHAQLSDVERIARLNDVLTSRDVNEIADAPAGEIQKRISLEADNVSRALEEQGGAPQTMKTKPPQMNTASIGPDGKVVFTKEGA
ncbi:MAG: hypothetical protein Q9208_003686 [Pyrenodesmia sp. 3 TL-2023]